MNPFGILSMATAGNTILIFASSSWLAATSDVHALQMAPFSTVHHRIDPFPPPSSKLFGSINYIRRRHILNDLRSAGADDAVDAEVVGDPPSTPPSRTSSSFLRALDAFGMKLKPWALSATGKSLKYSTINGDADALPLTDKVKSVLHKLEAIVLWVMYIVYRGYRGFFILLPAVFREVYRQLEESDLVVDVYGDDELEEKEYAANANDRGESQKLQVREPMKLRTRITISILSMMVTLSYVVSGALRVLGKFIKTFTNTTSVESSLEAAAEEVVANENILREKMK